MTQQSIFHTLGLSESLSEYLKDIGYTKPTDVQKRAIPLFLAKHDIIVQAQTGSGKTASFALPIIETLDKKKQSPQCLVLAPTRELALQVSDAFKDFCRYDRSKLNIACIYGGDDYKKQMRQIKAGAQIIVGTPGRLMDHLRRGSLDISNLTHVILDEADEMLRMGFIEDVEWILSHTPEHKQMALFSATMPQAIKKIAKTFLKSPSEVIIKQKSLTAKSINQSYIISSFSNKLNNLCRILEMHDYDGAICFARTRQDTLDITKQLLQSGFKAIALNGDIAQSKRKEAVDALKKKTVDIIVATDVAARGIDIERVSLVINYDLPFDHEAYVHRIGRTGRAGREGDAILFVTPKEERAFKQLQSTLNVSISPYKMPSSRDIHTKKLSIIKEKLSTIIKDKDLSAHKRFIDEYLSESGQSIETICAAILYHQYGNKINKPKEQKAELFSLPKRNKRSNERRNSGHVKRKKSRKSSGGERKRYG